MAGKVKRGGTWHLRMRVPLRYKAIEKRSEIHRSLKTRDEREADARLYVVEQQILAELDARLAGREPETDSHYRAIAEMASVRGWTYRTADELAAGSISDLASRFWDLSQNRDAPTSAAAAAALGGVQPPRRTIREMASQMAELHPVEIDNKDRQQLKDWKAKWHRVAERLVLSHGRDIAIDGITREHIQKLRYDLQVRVNDGTLDVDSANKDLQYLRRMIRNHHEDLNRTDPPDPTAGVRCKKVIRRKKSRKPPVPIEYLEKWVIMENWHGVNDELRDILLVCLETGARESEIYNLPPESIRLNDPIPHIIIQEEEETEEGESGRQIKTAASERHVPLVGVALDAMRRHPNGFPRYRGTRKFSNAATKALRSRGLIPTEPVSYKRMPGGAPRKPVYVTAGGVRHSFEDRLDAAGVAMDTRGALIGHDVARLRGRQHYGDKSLPERLALHERIMLRPPTLALPSPD